MPRKDAKPIPALVQLAATHPFFGPQALSPLHEVNECWLDFLIDAARRNLQPPPFPLIAPLRDLLVTMTESAKRQAARRPLLLVDLQFRNQEWWQQLTRSSGNGVQNSRTGRAPKRALVQISRATLMLTWHALRVDPGAACLLLGMAEPVADILLKLRLTEIDRTAEQTYQWMRPRWDDRPAVWRRLLVAAQSGDAHALREFDVHSIQLLAGEFIPATKEV